MFDSLPKDAQQVKDWRWEQYAPYFDDLAERPLTKASVEQWLADWTRLGDLLHQTFARLRIATTQDTSDQAAVERLQAFMKDVWEPAEIANNRLTRKLLDSGLVPPGYAVPLRALRAEAELFREDNVPLFTAEQKLQNEFNAILGAQTVIWDGEERTLIQLKPIFQSDDRALREKAWRAISDRRLADRGKLNDLWRRFLELRLKIARNAGYDDYRAFRWKQMGRFDYTPQDCEVFHAAIEKVVVPAASRIYERQRQLLGVDRLRPWDLDRDDVYPPSRPPLKPFQTVDELVSRAEAIFTKVDPELGADFASMRQRGLLDLDNRKGKAPGGYQATITIGTPFIFMNAVGVHDDVQTLLHEGGHAFHWMETSRHLPYLHQWWYTPEMAEVASMSMELLAAPYLAAKHGGFYSEADAAHARREHLEHLLLFWPFMAVVDAFQHWVYTHAREAADPANCDAKWDELWTRFIPGVDWSDLDDARKTGWQRKQHIFQYPFYYVDYGLAQVGAAQVWRNALHDQQAAVRQYRHALSLGGTRTLPQLYAAAGAKFAWDADTLDELVSVIESKLSELYAAV
ncbi:MAG: M3 family oligoendopeptidase [Chloroflexi bacterium]|nr:M3 family oligoendopeptidase [Chloroflexota bacterium]